VQLADVFTRIVGSNEPVRFQAYDGSRSGPEDADILIDVRSPVALHQIVTSPGELGIARA
jgi:cyclopropane-fatty-acyl-phospholipid synthase